MALIRATSGGGGSAEAYYDTLTNVASNSTTPIHCGFVPTQIMITETNCSNSSVWTYLYDENYATNKIRYMGSTGSGVDNWTDWNFGTSGSTIVDWLSDGFNWHTSSNRNIGRLDIMAIKK